MLKRLGNRQRRSSRELAGLVCSISPTENLCNRLEVQLFNLGLGNQDNSGSPVVERRGVGGRHSSRARNESGLDASKLIRVELEDKSQKSQFDMNDLDRIPSRGGMGSHILGLIILRHGDTWFTPEAG